MRVILDTSVIIAFLLRTGKNFTIEIIRLAKYKRITLLTSNEIIEELQKAISADRVKKSKMYDEQKVGRFVAWYKHNTVQVDSDGKSLIQHSRDSKDNIFISLAQFCKANFIISLDKDLLVLKKVGTTKIMKPKDFMQEYFQKNLS